jgi:competence protein ComEA
MNTVTISKGRKAVLASLALAAALVLSLLAATAHAEQRSRPAAASSASSPAAAGAVNLNTATEEELDRLPGVGPSKAAAIVAWRKKYGAFKRVEDITRVKGFGRKTLQRLKPYLSVSGATTLRAPEPARPTSESIVSRPPAEEAP